MMFFKRFKIYFFCFLIIIVVSSFVLLNPSRFQKWNSIKPVTEYNFNRLAEIGKYLDVDKMVSSIPYKRDSNYFIYNVQPEKKYKLTIVDGYGDCSNLSFGGAYYFIKNKIDFELIHFLPPDSLFSGGGHVAVRVPYLLNGVRGVGLLDIAGAGVPIKNNSVADYNDLKSFAADVTFKQLNKKVPSYFKNYYKQDYIDSVFLGFTPSSEVKRYFDFVDNFYIDIGSDKVEKMVFDGLSLVFGQYYNIYVSPEFFDGFHVERTLFRLSLFIIRLIILFFISLLLFEIVLIFKKKIDKKYHRIS